MVWSEVRILSGPPRSPMRTDVSRSLTNSPQFAGISAGSNAALIHGADHESGRRAGTESALLAVALGKACELAGDLGPMQRVRALRDRFWRKLQERFGNLVALNGDLEGRLPNTLNVAFVGR